MKNHKRSICSTCRHTPYCSLSTNMDNITSCSEYVHYLDSPVSPTLELHGKTDLYDPKKGGNFNFRQ